MPTRKREGMRYETQTKKQSNADRFCELAEQIVNATPAPTLPNYQIPVIVLTVMKSAWDNYGGFEEPYSDASAIERAVNDLLDHAKELGLHVCHQGEEIGAMGITVREEEESCTRQPCRNI